MNQVFYNEYLHQAGLCWSTEYNIRQGILLIPKNSSTFIRASLPLIATDFESVETPYIPIRHPINRFISGFVKFISRIKLLGDPGRGNIPLKKAKYDDIYTIMNSENTLRLRILDFLSYCENYGFIDPHIYPQSYFIKRATIQDIHLEFFDSSSSANLSNVMGRSGLKKWHTGSTYSISDKSQINVHYIRQGQFAKLRH